MFPSQYRDFRQPDILDCIANLSNDEVFTPPALANKVLDLLPKKVWTNEKLKFLDPCCKTGIFLREISRRLMEGLKKKIPDEKKRREHIFKNQVYGISITTLTSLMSRRSLYYSKDASGKKSTTVVKFQNPEGNIYFKPMNHSFKEGKCEFCGQSRFGDIGKREMDGSLETHAYNFIHQPMEGIFNMKFDVIVGNPPYQLNSSGFGAQATPIYNKFIEQSKKLNPRYIAFIIPSRWFVGGMGLNSFRKSMLSDRKIKAIYDYPNASDCFPGVEIKGGVMYFIRDINYDGDCEIHTVVGDVELPPMKRRLNEFDVFVRYNSAISILKKVRSIEEETIDKNMSGLNPFGLPTNFDKLKSEKKKNDVLIYANKKNGYLSREEIKLHPEWIDGFKVLLPKAGEGSGDFPNRILGRPIIAENPSACTMTYFIAGNFDSRRKAENYSKYIKTKFFRFLVSLRKSTQDTSRDKFSFVPTLDMSEEWTDEKLYQRYDLDDEEIKFIDSMIREMN